jgi:hypothetical protein
MEEVWRELALRHAESCFSWLVIGELGYGWTGAELSRTWPSTSVEATKHEVLRNVAKGRWLLRQLALGGFAGKSSLNSSVSG